MSPKETKRQECEIYSRITGYLRPTSQWNDAQQEIFKDRKTFNTEKYV